MAHSGRGGSRPGAGRKPGTKTSAAKRKPKSVRRRIPISLWEKIKSGYFEDIEALLNDWQFRSEDASPTSPRWEKVRELLEELKQISE